jgi:uncharacterized membrane protein
METAPAWVLTIAYWLHMLATVVWVGGLAALVLIVLPAARKTVKGQAYSDFVALLQNRLQSLGWFSLAVLAVTGMFQMSSSPFYKGFLAISNTWAAAILVKHLMIGLMLILSVYLTWGIMPELQRTALIKKAGKEIDPRRLERLERREEFLLRANLILSILVLALTAVARSA